MGYRMYSSVNPEETNNEYDNSICYGKFYGYADYKYVKKSFEYLAPIVIKQDPEAFGFYNMEEDDMYECYRAFSLGGGTPFYKLTSDQFKEFISLYRNGQANWLNHEEIHDDVPKSDVYIWWS